MKTYLLTDKRIFDTSDRNDSLELTNSASAYVTFDGGSRRADDYGNATNEIAGFVDSRKPCKLIVATFYYRLPGFVDSLRERTGCTIDPTFKLFASTREHDELHSVREIYGDIVITTTFFVENGAMNILAQSIDPNASPCGKPTVFDLRDPDSLEQDSLKHGTFGHSMPVPEYEAKTIPETKRFRAKFDARMLTEANDESHLAVKKITGKEIATGRLTIPTSRFERTSFRVGGLKLVEFSISCGKDYFNNLHFKIRTLDNESFYGATEFYGATCSLVRLLKKDFILRYLSSASENSKNDDALRAAVATLLDIVDPAEREKRERHAVENIRALLALRKAGELRTIDDWTEGTNIEEDLKLFDRKLGETLSEREPRSLDEIEKRKKEVAS